jgi:hypothetical protein
LLITTIGLTALGMPDALYLRIITGLLEIIPTIGPIIGAVPAVIVALVPGSTYLDHGGLARAMGELPIHKAYWDNEVTCLLQAGE